MYLSILKIRNTTTAKENANDSAIFLSVNSDKVKRSLQKSNPRKTIAPDKIHPALIKMASESLSTALPIAINNR